MLIVSSLLVLTCLFQRLVHPCLDAQGISRDDSAFVLCGPCDVLFLGRRYEAFFPSHFSEMNAHVPGTPHCFHSHNYQISATTSFTGLARLVLNSS